MLYTWYKDVLDRLDPNQPWRTRFMKNPPMICDVQPRVFIWSPTVDNNKLQNLTWAKRESLYV